MCRNFYMLTVAKHGITFVRMAIWIFREIHYLWKLIYYDSNGMSFNIYMCIDLWIFCLTRFPASPTTAAQMSLSNPTMLRTHSLSNADGPYDPYSDTRFRNSSVSLDEKSRAMSRSGSFRDGFEEGEWTEDLLQQLDKIARIKAVGEEIVPGSITIKN